MERNITFCFELDKTQMHHIKEKSRYNHNYYRLNLNSYGDLIIPEKCDILLETAEDDCYDTYYTLGYFDENDEFQPCWTWLDDWKMLM